MAGISGEQWSSRAGFLMAAIGFSVGLGNIWRFPYVTGENGGGAFLIVYLICAFGIGLPLLIGELMIGRRGGGSPTHSMKQLAQESGKSAKWSIVGTVAVFAVFIIMTYYTVIAGWTMDYFVKAASGALSGVDGAESAAIFSSLTGSPWRLLFWSTIVNILVVIVLRRGVQAGIEKAVGILMPALFVCLLIMVGYAIYAGDMAKTISFLFQPDFSKLTFETIMVAVGQAFFSIGIGMAGLITFGSYLSKDTSIPGSSAIIISADTGVALLAGMAIFPLVFTYGLEPSGGAGLIFETLPVAFGQMPGGQIFGALFFLLLIAAALTSCLGGIESVVVWIDENWNIDRHKGALYAGLATWVIGILSILSLNEWSTFYPLDFIPVFEGKIIFDALDFLAANILLLLGGLLSAIFLGWFIPKQMSSEEINMGESGFYTFWLWSLRIAAPVVLIIVLALGITE